MSTKPLKDRSNLFAFTFADGRHCRTPRGTMIPLWDFKNGETCFGLLVAPC